MPSITLKRLIDKMKLVNLTDDLDISKIRITQPDLNRPALQLAGYFDYFDCARVQVIGFVEYTFLETLDDDRKQVIYDQLLSYVPPAVVFCRDLAPDELFMETAMRYHVPVLSTKKSTSAFMAETIRWLNVKLAPCISVHGVLVDVIGEGVLLTG